MKFNSEAEVLKFITDYAKDQGYQLNPDQENADRVIKGLFMRYQAKGELYCPCRLMTGDEEADKNIICPCKYHHDEIEEKGICHCNLLARNDDATS